MYDNFKESIKIDTHKVLMDVRELRAFTILAEELNFRKAADRLGMTQPPLTRLISQLEASLGVPLFIRTTRKVELTGAGLHLIKKSRLILEEIEKTESEIRSLNETKSGKLAVSLSGPALHSNVPRLIGSFKDKFPKVKVELIETTLGSLARSLKSGKIDMVFGVHAFIEPSLKNIDVQIHELGLLVPVDNALSKKKSIELSDLEGETLIFHGKHEHLGFQAEFLRYLESKDIHVRVYYKKVKENCSHLVMLNKGLLMTSRSMISHNSGSVYVPFNGFSRKMKIYGTWSSENDSIHLQALISFLEENLSVPYSGMDSHLA